jgi:hypothetical protein
LSGEASFEVAVAAFHAGRDAVAEARGDLVFEEWPAPKRLAPFAAALAVTAYLDGEEAGTGRLILLHDPAGQQGWTGTFRIIGQVSAEIPEELTADIFLGATSWSCLTDALDLHAPGYRTLGGTASQTITEGYGTREAEPPSAYVELRISWSPGQDMVEEEIIGAVRAWSDVVAAMAGMPAQPPETKMLGRWVTTLRERPRTGGNGDGATRGTA